MLKTILIALPALVAVVLVLVQLQPAEFRVVRGASISAPPAAVFAQVNDFHNWEAWSPWARRDPAAKKTYEGPSAGTGAMFAWSGNHEVGEGRMTIIESRPGELIRIRLDFVRPFASTSTAEFSFTPDGPRTAVRWSMAGRKNFVSKAIGLVMNMDTMIGGDFDKGLAALASATETTTSARR